MDAEDVSPDAWEGRARAMAARDKLDVHLYMIETCGAWTIRGRVTPAGAVSA